MNTKKWVRKLIPKPILNLRHLLWAWYGAVKYKHPSEELLVIGVTGTSGKSSTIYLLRQLLEKAGFRVGALSTIDFYIDGEQKLNDKKMTMLGKMEIQKYLRKMVDKKCDVAIIETTSEGRLQHRHRFINYDMMVLTNLYPEHIEAHGSFAKYKAAKLDLFRYVSSCRRKRVIGNWKLEIRDVVPKTCFVNGNNKYAEEFLQFDFDQKIVFARKDNNNSISNIQYSIFVDNIKAERDGLHFTIDNIQFHAPLYGEHNVMNITAAISVARALDIEWNVLQKAVSELEPIPGRIEFIKEAEKFGFQVIIDYAFELGAFKALYEVVDLLKPQGRIIHVCGSTGGGRDKARRIPIGRFVGEKSDIFIVTDEDPYDEDPVEIIKTVSAGAREVGKVLNNNLFEILDRKEAIQKAIEMAQKGDLILITGKGSEQKMCVAGVKMIDWDDREIAREALRNKKQS